MSNATATDDPTTEERKARRTALRVLLAFVVVGAATCALVRGIGHLAEAAGSPSDFREEAIGITRALPAIAKTDDAILLFGTSHVKVGLAPEIVDDELRRAGKRGRTFNLGLTGIKYSHLAKVVERVAREFRRQGRRPAAIVVQFSPAWLVQTPEPVAEAEWTMLAGGPADYLDRVRERPEDGLRLFGRRYGLGGYTGSYIAYRFGSWIDDDVPFWFGELSPEEVLGRQVPRRVWTFENRGSPSLGADGDERYRRWFDATRGTPISRAPRRTFDEGQIAGMIDALEQARSISDRVVLLLMPRNRCAGRQPSEVEPETSQVIERIVREGGRPLVIDHRTSTALACDDFEDMKHLALHRGTRTFSRTFGRLLAPLL